jgi:hypothetical protein
MKNGFMFSILYEQDKPISFYENGTYTNSRHQIAHWKIEEGEFCYRHQGGSWERIKRSDEWIVAEFMRLYNLYMLSVIEDELEMKN